jgi:hypothetical protein
MPRFGFKSVMTLTVSGGLLIALGVGLGALWFSPALRLAMRSAPSTASRAPALVVVSSLPPDSGLARPETAPAARRPDPDNLPNPPPSSGKPKLPEAQVPEQRGQARLAIVIDDLGYNLSMPERLLALGAPITFSIIPGEMHSLEVAQRARRAGRDFIVHIPMEPAGYPRDDPGPNALLLRTDDEQTRAQVSAQLDSLPGAVGANNHMGSAYTADVDKMGIVQRQIAARGLVFLNSKTAPTPVPAGIAHAQGYAYLERDVFLDNERSESAIRNQLSAAVHHARAHGHAIAIGHPYPETYRVLRDRLPHLAQEGVILVPISQIGN